MANYSMHANAEPDFEETVKFLIKKYNIQSIIETGTFHGDGSTSVFARTGLRVTTIECNPQSNAIAKINLRPFPNVDPLWGYSLPLSEMRDFIDKDDIYDRQHSLGIQAEGDSPTEAKAGYNKELGAFPIPEDLLRVFGDVAERQIIFLDSAGGVGYAEFKKFLQFNNIGNKVLMLDDVQHVKHYRSFLDLTNSGKQYTPYSHGRGGWTSFIQEENI